MKKVIFSVLLLFLLFFAGYGVAVTKPQNSRQLTGANGPWPPQIGEAYPDLDLIDQDGKAFRLSELKGYVIIVEPVGMNCPACQAFSGAHDVGAFENNPVQSGLSSFRKLLPAYAGGLRFPHKDIIFVQLLLYDMNLDPPAPDDAARWARHFGFEKANREIVAVSPQDLRSDASYNLIPGFQLIDRDFILRSDSTGHSPRDDLYRMLLPMVPEVLKLGARDAVR